MVLTLAGMVISDNALQLSNAFSPISRTEEGGVKWTVVRLLRVKKAKFPIRVTG